MKRKIIDVLNAGLALVDAELVRRNSRFRVDSSSVLRRFAESGLKVGTVIDIGASDGKWSVGNAKYFPGAKFLAVEPLEERREALERTKRARSDFDFALCVAGDTDGAEVTLNVAPDLDGTTVEGRGEGRTRRCPVRTIDSLVAERGLPGDYFLKFDTHGYELPILAGCAETLRGTAAIFMEVYNFELTSTSLKFHDMCKHLETLGFRVADIADPVMRPRDGIFWQCDLLFLRASSPQFSYPHYK